MRFFLRVSHPTFILLLSDSFISIAEAMFGPIYALFVEKVGGDLLSAGLAWSAFSLSAGVVTFFSGKIVDRIKDPELVLVTGYIIEGLGFGAMAFVNNLYQLLAVQVLLGLGQPVYAPAFDTLYMRHMDKEKGGYTWALWEADYYIMDAIGALIGGLVAKFLGFQALFFIMAGICFMVALYILFLPREEL